MENSNTFTTSRGITVTCLSIATLLDKLDSQFTPPQPPTYEVPTATGAKEIHAHSHRIEKVPELDAEGKETGKFIEREETTLETDEDRAVWADYLRRRRDNAAAHQRAISRLILLRGIDFAMPTDDTWVRTQELVGMTVPEDPLERRLHYAETEIVGNAQDMEELVVRTFLQSGVDEEVVRQMEKSFRRSLGRSRRNAAERSDGAPAAEQERVEPVAAVRASGNGSEGGALAERV